MTAATSRIIQRALASTGPWTTITTVTPTATTYKDTSVTNGTEYFYRVIGVNAVGNSAPSNVASATPSGGAGLKTDLVHWWEMDEASGTRFDSHGSLDLTESGGAVASRNVIGGDGIDISQAGTEILLASPGATPAFSQNTLTVAAWTTIDALASFNTIFSYGTNAAAPPWTSVALTMGYRSSPGAFEVFFGHGGTFAQIQGTTFGAVSPSTLYLVAAYLDTTNNLMGISVDGGAWQTAANANGAFNAGAAYDITVGRYKTVAPFRLDGGAARIGMWNRVLSNADLTTLYNSGAGLRYADL